MLMDPQCKKLFAKSFIRLYEKLQDDFLRGDHEHEVSVREEEQGFSSIVVKALFDLDLLFFGSTLHCTVIGKIRGGRII